MRLNRLRRLWPILEPKIISVAQRLIGPYNGWVEDRDLAQEAFMALRMLKTTKIRPLTNSYLITYSRYRMIDYLRKAKPLDFTMINIDPMSFLN